MSEGFIENGEQLLGYLKMTGLPDHDESAVEAINTICDALVKEIDDQRLSAVRRSRMKYYAGVVHGIRIAVTAIKIKGQNQDELNPKSDA